MTEQEPWASVILPTHNRANLLPRAVDSVLGQTYSDFELLIVDDGSTDETPEVNRSWADPRIHVFRLDTPGGAAKARNYAARHARGEVIVFLDDDDEYLSEFLQSTHDAYQQAPSTVGFSWCGTEVVEDNPGGEKTLLKAVWEPETNSQQDAHHIFLKSRKIGTNCGLGVRRSDFQQLGGFDERFPCAEDTDLLIRLARSRDYVVIPKILIRIHRHPGPRLTTYDSRMAGAYELLIEKNSDTLRENRDLSFELNYKAGWLHYYSGHRRLGRTHLRSALRRDKRRLRGWLALAFFELLGPYAPPLHRVIARIKGIL